MIENGLLHYSSFEANYSAYDPEEEKEENPSGGFPLRFKMDRLSLYFDNQLKRFREYLAREEPDYGTSTCPWRVEILAREWVFTKPWYEFHADRLLGWIDGGLHCLRQWAADPASKPIGRTGRAPWDCDFAFSGQLGRLIERYYWKFRFEKDALAGGGARKELA